LGELVAGVAHEINNPLTGISAFAELLLEDELNDEQRESVQLIKRESDRATQVIRDLLLFARKSDAARGLVDVNALLEQTLRLRAYVLRSSEIEVSLHLDESCPTVQGDEQRLQQVILNLMTNAEHAMEGRPHRHLALRTRGDLDRVLISVQDTGHGMEPAVQQRLFEPFFTTKPPGLGTGLGLSVSYGIAQAHNGTLEVQSTANVGTMFTLNLPAGWAGRA
jgi:two-component system NtrC family sensor kinase